MLAWLLLVGTLSRRIVVTLLSRPGTGTPGTSVSVAIAVETGVLPRSFSEATWRSGVWTAM